VQFHHIALDQGQNVELALRIILDMMVEFQPKHDVEKLSPVAD
jgi:hypothetical protein